MATLHITFSSDRVFEGVDTGFARLTILAGSACFHTSRFAAEPRLAAGAAELALLAIPVLRTGGERS